MADGPSSPTGSITPTQDEDNPASPDPTDAPASPDVADTAQGPASPEAPANDDDGPASPENDNSGPASPDGGGTPTQDESVNQPAPPDGRGPGTPTQDEGPASPDMEQSGPASPDCVLEEEQVATSENKETDNAADKDNATHADDEANREAEKASEKGSEERKDDKSDSSSDSGSSSDSDSPKSPASKSDKGDDSDNEENTTPSKKRIDSDSEDEGAKKGEDGEENTPSTSKRRLDSSSDEDEIFPQKQKKKLLSDAESDSETKKETAGEDGGKEEGGDAIADIFGDSSDDEGEFQGFDETEIKSSTAATEGALPEEVSSDDELDDDGPSDKGNFVSDFDEMMARKKEERSNARSRKRNVDIINDSDDLIVDMLKRMKEAAEEDRNLNLNHQPATRKLKMLPTIERQLNKSELQTAFMDCGVLSALTEWLAPLPDKSLPHLSVRQKLLKILTTLPHPHTDQLKSSGIGKAIMYLFKHPKELRTNKEMAGRLINEWSRPIFGQSSNFKSVNREDLQKRDMASMKKRRRSSDGGKKEEEEQKALRPGDPGWIYRARVPAPSNRDYVVRPESNVDPEANFKPGSSKRKKTRYDLQKQKMDNKKKAMKSLTAVKISIEGRNM